MARRKANVTHPGSAKGRRATGGAAHTALSAKEYAERRTAMKLGRALNLRVMKILTRRVTEYEAIEDQLRKDKQTDSFIAKNKLACVLTNMDLIGLNRDLQDRYGQPRRSQTEIELDSAQPLLIKIAGGLNWPAQPAAEGDEPEERDARARAH